MKSLPKWYAIVGHSLMPLWLRNIGYYFGIVYICYVSCLLNNSKEIDLAGFNSKGFKYRHISLHPNIKDLI